MPRSTSDQVGVPISTPAHTMAMDGDGMGVEDFVRRERGKTGTQALLITRFHVSTCWKITMCHTYRENVLLLTHVFDMQYFGLVCVNIV